MKAQHWLSLKGKNAPLLAGMMMRNFFLSRSFLFSLKNHSIR